MATILLLNGPNLNLLGTREPATYGHATLDSIVDDLAARTADAGHVLQHFQSNHEGALVDRIHQAAAESVDALIFNPGAYTHNSIALRDAVLATGLPLVEVHLSNIHAREAFRHTSLLSDIARGVIVGLGPAGYGLALAATIQQLDAA